MTEKVPPDPALRSILKPDSLVELSFHVSRSEPAELSAWENNKKVNAKWDNRNNCLSVNRRESIHLPPFAHVRNAPRREHSKALRIPMQATFAWVADLVNREV